MADWVHAAERAYVAAAVGRRGGATAAASPAGLAPGAAATAGAAATGAAATGAAAAAPAPWTRHARAIAAAGAVASRYLAVGTPRSFGIVIDDDDDADGDAHAEPAALSLIAHRTWFAPRDIRCAARALGAARSLGAAHALAAATGGRTVSVDEALACDIVCVYSAATPITPSQLRRGTHVNLLTAASLDPELLQLATVVHEADLPALAAGLVDGRQLDELTLFIIDGAPIAAAALAASA